MSELPRLFVRIGALAAVTLGIVVPLGSAAGSPPVGSLSFMRCISDGATDGCTAATAASSLAGIGALVVSPDGKSVYAAAGDASAITWFARSARGVLTDKSCYSSSVSTGCTTPVQPSLSGAQQVAVSPDGKSVYVAAEDASAVSWFARAASGSLTYKGCVADTTDNGCAAVTHPSLDGVDAVAVSPDGKNVYVTAEEGGSVSVFGRSSSGALHDEGCLAGGGENGCATAGDSIGEPTGLAISANGKSVYVVAGGLLTAFTRATAGGLTQTQCFADSSVPGCVTNLHTSMESADSVTVSRDGKNVYVAAAGSSAPCTSPHVFKKLKKGRHHVSVEAINGQGRRDLTPAERTEKLKK